MTPRVLALPAPAKLNLLLRIIGQRDDGYHLLQTVFQFLDYGDTLTFEVLPYSAIEYHGDLSNLGAKNNLIYQAAHLLKNTYQVAQGIKIHLAKRLPLGGGLGGGSSDAATTLLALNQLWGLALSPAELATIALTLGADVPIFIAGTAAWAEGVGEKLTPMTLAEDWYLVVIPDCHVSTQEIFTAKDLTRDSIPITMRDFTEGVRDNDCLATVCRHYPQVKQALVWLQQFEPAYMSGTGASVFASFQTKASAEKVLDQLPNHWQGFVAKGLNQSPLLKCLGLAKDML